MHLLTLDCFRKAIKPGLEVARDCNADRSEWEVAAVGRQFRILADARATNEESMVAKTRFVAQCDDGIRLKEEKKIVNE